MASIARLGFDVRDVTVLLDSEPHYDHAGGLAELQRASSAKPWGSEASAPVLAAGGGEDAEYVPLVWLFLWTGIFGYPRPRVDHRFRDGDTIPVGPIAIAAHVTPGLPADVWVTSHAREWDHYRKFAARDTAGDSVAPFLDPAWYGTYVDGGEARFRRGVVHLRVERALRARGRIPPLEHFTIRRNRERRATVLCALKYSAALAAPPTVPLPRPIVSGVLSAPLATSSALLPRAVAAQSPAPPGDSPPSVAS